MKIFEMEMLLFALNLVTLLMQIQSTASTYASSSSLLFALNLVTLLMQIQFHLHLLQLSIRCYLL